MNFNKCERCGCFFVTDGSTCPSCVTKDANDLSKLNNFFSENINALSINELSNLTGISTKNINRFITDKNFSYKNQITL